jgi:multiple sugar transport system substrate-binding protein
MKNRFKVLAATTVLLFSLTACGSSSGNTGAESKDLALPADKAISAELSYAIWNPKQQPALETVISKFQEQYPNIKVNMTVTPSKGGQYWTKLQTEANGKNLPDVFWMNGPNVQLYAANGQLQSLQGLYDAGSLDAKNYPAALSDLYTYEDTKYGVPKDYDTVGLWYNKQIFEEAGVDTPSAEWTWEDFHSAAKTISDKLKAKGIHGAALETGTGQTSWYNLMEQQGESAISADGKQSGYSSEAAEKSIQFMADLIADGSSPNIQQLSDTDANQRFANGQLGMYWGGSWQTALFKDSVVKDSIQVAPLPKGERQASIIHGLANVISSTSKHKEAAAAFVNYLGSEEAALIQAKAGIVIPAFNGTQADFVSSVPAFDLQVFLDAADNYSFAYPVSKNTAVWEKSATDLLPSAWNGSRSAKDVLAELSASMNDALAKE